MTEKKAFILCVLTLILMAGNAFAAEIDRNMKLVSLKPEAVLSVLDLSGPGLEQAKAAADRGDRIGALAALLSHYREKYPLSEEGEGRRSRRGRSLERADKIVNHIFQWGPYEEADYGKEIDWEWDPRGDIEWVASIYRFSWARPLAWAYRTSGDEKYAQAFVDLTADWIAKHPLEKRERTHPVYTRWRGFAWLDIQTGRRATSMCSAFKTLVHADAFTPEFLGTFLASMYDHQVKTEKIPMGRVHNKAVFEQRGFINIAATFPEFKDTRRWLELAKSRTRESFLAQVTEDGVQREWSFGYHRGVMSDAIEIMELLADAGISVADDYKDRIRLMYDYIFWVTTPDLGAPMFGDASRSPVSTEDRSRWSMYRTLMRGTELLDDPKYAARATLDRKLLPQEKSHAFTLAGMYVLRNDWGPDQIHMGLHCSPLGISGHDQPDNGTFELYAYGRWLMPDTGFYTYGHDAKARQWHRQTQVHQTMTLNGDNAEIAGRHLLWQSQPGFDALTVENGSYEGLVHRRTVWFVDRKFFVILDEAMGQTPGALDLHFQFAPGEVRLNTTEKWARTGFEDANVLVWTDPEAPVTMAAEEGWFAWRYGSRASRVAVRYRHEGEAPTAFLTLVVPFQGTETPVVSGALPADFVPGADRVTLKVSAFGNSWDVGRNLENGKAWCRK